jgi:hypothetical protein
MMIFRSPLQSTLLKLNNLLQYRQARYCRLSLFDVARTEAGWLLSSPASIDSDPGHWRKAAPNASSLSLASIVPMSASAVIAHGGLGAVDSRATVVEMGRVECGWTRCFEKRRENFTLVARLALGRHVSTMSSISAPSSSLLAVRELEWRSVEISSSLSHRSVSRLDSETDVDPRHSESSSRHERLGLTGIRPRTVGCGLSASYPSTDRNAMLRQEVKRDARISDPRFEALFWGSETSENLGESANYLLVFNFIAIYSVEIISQMRMRL